MFFNATNQRMVREITLSPHEILVFELLKCTSPRPFHVFSHIFVHSETQNSTKFFDKALDKKNEHNPNVHQDKK